MKEKLRNIIWDWNGTLLNDVDICVLAMNKMLSERSLPRLTVTKYRQVFTFPVKEYYEQIGFNFSKESFDVPALQFIDDYQKLLPTAELFTDVKPLLKYLHGKGLKQFVLSAMEQNNLLKSINHLGIKNHFKQIMGIDNHFAFSKINRGKDLIAQNKLNIKETVLVGDTLHDMEVANAIGIKCILIARGHQSYNRLKVNGNTVIKQLAELQEML